MEKAVIDRIVDGNQVVLLVGVEEREYIILSSRLPKGAKESSWLKVQIENGDIVHIELDEYETDKVKKRIADKMALLKKKKSSQFRRGN
jgi:hypothetical protein